jgi:hypothetical protein
MKTVKKLLVLCAALACLASCDGFWASVFFDIRDKGWEVLGEPDVSEGGAESYYFDVSADDEIFVAYHKMIWSDAGPSSNLIYVKRFTGDSWQQVGTTIEMPNIPHFFFCLDEEGNPVIAYPSDAIGGIACVRWVGGAWQPVGVLSLVSCMPNALECAPAGDLYLAYQDSSDENRVTVQAFDGISWSVLNPAFDLPAGAYDGWKVCLAPADDGSVYLGLHGEGVDTLSVYRYSASSWALFGDAISTGYASNISIAPTSTPGRIYMLYSDSGAVSRTAIVKYFNGVAWDNLSIGMADGESEPGAIALDSADVPFVVYTDFAIEDELNVMRYSAGSWSAMGEKGFTYGDVAQMSQIELMADGTPVIAYEAVGHGHAVTVMRYTGN